MMSSNSAKNIFQFEYIPITSVFEPINSFKKKKNSQNYNAVTFNTTFSVTKTFSIGDIIFILFFFLSYFTDD